MSKSLTEAPITTRNARSGLPIGVHWRGIDPEVHLGYRKGKRGGVWVVRWRSGINYTYRKLGTADDVIKSGTLDFEAARRAARALVEKARADAKASENGEPLTVRMVAEAYIADRDARDARRKGREVRSDANQRLRRHVLGQEGRGKKKAISASPLADVALHTLTEEDLKTWRKALPASLKATAVQRTINDLKAALNAAYETHRQVLDPTLPAIIKQGLKSKALEEDDAEMMVREDQILSEGQVSALLRAAREIDEEQSWDGDLFRLIVVLAATGARFSQVARMTVADVQRDKERLLVPTSRKGKPGKTRKKSHETVPIGRDVLDVLLPAMTGRLGDAPLLERWRKKQKPGGIEWEKSDRGPWRAPSEMNRPWDAVRDRAGMPGVVPYALRHTSIVRDIKANMPIRLLAAKHDTSVAMVEKHYARWITSGLEAVLRQAVVPLVPVEGSGNVLPLRAG